MDARLALCIVGEKLMACEISLMCVGIRGVVCGGLWGVGRIGRGRGSRNVKVVNECKRGRKRNEEK